MEVEPVKKNNVKLGWGVGEDICGGTESQKEAQEMRSWSPADAIA